MTSSQSFAYIEILQKTASKSLKKNFRNFLILLLLFGASSHLRSQNTDSVYIFEVYFELDIDTINELEKIKLDTLFEHIPIAAVENIVVYGHTDSFATQNYNRDLSRRRAQNISNYLHLTGIDVTKLKFDFYGEENPKYANSEDTRALNRRCEVHLSMNPTLLPESSEKLVNMEFKRGNKVRIPNLVFVGNQAIPMGRSFEAMTDLLRAMHKFPDLVIELQGHVCCFDDHRLSVERAKMVYTFLLNNGIEKERMRYRGFSNKKPLNKEKTPEDKEMNRRVEVFVIKNTTRVAKIPSRKARIDIVAPVLNVTFFPSKARLYPASDFMLTLISEAIMARGNLHYEFIIFNNINDVKLTTSRAASLQRVLLNKEVTRSRFKASHQPKYPNMRQSNNENKIMVKISRR